MSRFRSSAALVAETPRLKVLVWGMPGVGKTHFGMTFPTPAVIDFENRARAFAGRFEFDHAAVGSLAELAEALKEVRTLPNETIVIDSASAIYKAFERAHTGVPKRDGTVNEGETDYVTVNKRFAALISFAFASDKNVVFTAHTQEKMQREGRDFKKLGANFTGDQRLRYALDYIFRMEPTGVNPATHPPRFTCEKSSSPNIVVGEAIIGLTYASLVARIAGKQPSPAPAPAAKIPSAEESGLKGEQLADAIATGAVAPPARPDTDPVDDGVINAIVAAAEQVGLDDQALVDLSIRTIKTPAWRQTTVGNARALFAAIAHLRAA